MKKKFVKKSLAWLLALMMVITFMPTGVMAEDGDETVQPATLEAGKTIDYERDDGAYEIELSVKGDSNPAQQATNSVNVLLVYDVSQSMTNNGQTNPNRSRADLTENVVHGFLDALLEKQEDSEGAITVNTALVTFGQTYDANQSATTWGKITDDFVDRFDEGLGEQVDTYNFSYSSTGTNWDAALRQANTVLGNLENNYPTFVIMITDGAPTASGAGNSSVSPDPSTYARLGTYYEAAKTPAQTIQSRANTDLYGIFAFGSNNDLLRS